MRFLLFLGTPVGMIIFILSTAFICAELFPGNASMEKRLEYSEQAVELTNNKLKLHAEEEKISTIKKKSFYIEKYDKKTHEWEAVYCFWYTDYAGDVYYAEAYIKSVGLDNYSNIKYKIVEKEKL
jgi:hypothetical protein